MLNNRGATSRSIFELRVTSALLMTTLTVLAVACLAFLWQEWQLIRTAEKSNIQAIVTLLVEDMADDLYDGDLTEVRKTLARIRELPGVETAEILAPGGEAVARYAGGTGSVPIDAGQSRFRDVSISYQGKFVGLLRMQTRPTGIMEVAPTIAAMFAMLFFGASGCALIIGRSFARRVAGPVDDLSRVMSEIAETDSFQPLAAVGRSSMFPKLIDAFNRLISHIDDRDRKLRASLEALTAARDAADQANSAKSLFLANVSHEIRTPLNGIVAMAELMEIGDLPDVQRERLVIMRQSTEALSVILNDLLDLSKIEAGRMELEVRDFDMQELAKSVQRSFAAVADKKGLEFVVEVAPAVQGGWLGDPGRIRQICNNLVSNAIKFTAHGKVLMQVRATEAGMELVVSDTGIGIDLEKTGHLFESFTQADASTTRKYGGTGLGLSICRELSELMGGKISVESRLGQGSSFKVSLPLARSGNLISPSSARSLEDPQVRDCGRLRILAADDNPTNRKVVSSILSVLEVELFQATDGQDALDQFMASEFDLVLMDIQMPVMDGIAACQKIREHEVAIGARRTPILALSANAMDHQISAYLEAGMDGHVTKPIEIARLFSAIHDALEASRQIPDQDVKEPAALSRKS